MSEKEGNKRKATPPDDDRESNSERRMVVPYLPGLNLTRGTPPFSGKGQVLCT
jgi:hypothetical protein